MVSTDPDRWAVGGVAVAAAAFAVSVLVAVAALAGADIDALTAMLLLLVSGVSAVVQLYARRYLRHDPAQRRWVVLATAVMVTSMALVTTTSFVGLTIAWVLSGLAVTALVGPQVRPAFLIGDGALVVAAVLHTVFDANAALAPVVATLIVVAALARCAQLPLPSWLPTTLDAPTPTSALLHAGVVNGGGLLLIRLAPQVNAWVPAWYLLAVAAGVTAWWGAAAVSSSPDVKGSLVRSTSAQMGFMLLTVAAGVPAAAVTHLVAHGMYKAALFLGSGNAVHASVEHHRLPPAPPRASWPSWPMVIGAAVPAVVLVLGAMAFALPANKWILLVFAWASTTIAASGWLRRRHDGRGVAWFVGSTVVGVGAYLGVVVFVSHLLESSLPAIGGAPGTIGLVLLLLATAGLAVVQALPDRFAELHDRLYVLSLGGVR